MTRMRKILKMLMVIILLVLILIFILVMLILETTRRNKYDEQIALGDKYLAERDYDQAELCFKRAINISDKIAEPYIKLANVYRETGDFEEAVSIVQSETNSGQGMTAQQKEILESYVNEIQAVAKADTKNTNTNKSSESGNKIVADVKANGGSEDIVDDEDYGDDGEADMGDEEPEPDNIEASTDSGEDNVGQGDDSDNENPDDNKDNDTQGNAGQEGSDKSDKRDLQMELRKIVQDTTGLSYIGDMGYGVTAVNSGEQTFCNSIGASGYLAADRRDYDADGTDEILVIALQGGEISAVKQDVFYMYMLKQDGESWRTEGSCAIGTESMAETERTDAVLRSNIFPARIQFFVNQAGGSVDIFMEMTSKAGIFNSKAPYSIQKYTYTGENFVCSDQGLWIEDLNNNGNLFADVLQSLNAWGLSAAGLGYGNEVMGQNSMVTPLVIIDKVSCISENTYSGWDWSVPYENMGRVVFTDNSNANIPDETVPGTIDLLDISLGISREDFCNIWQPILGGAQAVQSEATDGKEVYSLTKEVFYPDIPLKVEFVFENNELMCMQFSNILSSTESYGQRIDAGDDGFIDKCIRKFGGQPEVFSFEGGMYSWNGIGEQADLIRRPGIIEFSRWDNTQGENFALSLGQ